jgi:hypothetical protein
VHGDADTSVPIDHGEMMYAALTQREACASRHLVGNWRRAVLQLVTLATAGGWFAISDRPFARTVIRYLPPKVLMRIGQTQSRWSANERANRR